MKKMINRFLYISKVFLLLICFIISFYAFLLMHNYDNFSILSIILGFIPFLLVLLVFVFSFSLKRNIDSTYFNIVNVMAFVVLFMILVRTFFDNNMVYVLDHRINYYYFKNQLPLIKILLYLIFIGNIMLASKKKA